MEMHPHTMEADTRLHHLCCNACGKSVSSGFLPAANELGTKLVVRAWVECPECMEKEES